MPQTRTVNTCDLLIIGAGLAGLKAAQIASAAGLSVWLADENPLPGGQLLRQVTQSPFANPQTLFGEEYSVRRSLAEVAFSPRVCYLARTAVWQVTSEKQAYLLEQGDSPRQRVVQARFILLATGAQERSFPLPGWTLPGAMTVGAAQLLMKSAGLLPPADSILVGNGPLLLLFAAQVIRVGGRIQAVLDTTRPQDYLRALPRLPKALRHTSRDLFKGIKLLRELQRAKVPYYSGVTDIAIEGETQVTAVRFSHRGHPIQRVTSTVLSHIGVIPATQCANALGCKLVWDDEQHHWQPEVDERQESSQPGIYLAGDADGIEGGEAAMLSGQLAALSIVHAAGKLPEDDYHNNVLNCRNSAPSCVRCAPFWQRFIPFPNRHKNPMTT
ncbi:FAD/NAD(P)-binding oxidoreductase [Candidatus Symbiopectobacterium sp. 'North America']|uniref:NAD(P)/FAD-dependent oxidoreductase n=1 Tax=Candidatus Symbiopectobacterium sp. 'North America' TaxID=2794574 RepID=UPI0018CB7D58|nr:FAD-dependent oxidoreductase [Candidatus Symbiopectobacterium sp. 'North America']MBG6243956.1 FAD/NAD(P)-binding oxidoreductase [Candidatus Symbiopectobacterium sp. 'North America']